MLPILASLHARRQLAAAGRSALVAVERLKNPRALMWVGGALVAIFVVASVVAWHELGAGTYLSSVAAASPLLVPVALLEPWRIIRSQPATWRLYDELQERDSDAPVYLLGALAAWPRRHRHGSALIAALLDAKPVRGFVVAYPRDRELRDWYLWLGMLEHAGGALYLDLLQLPD